MYVFEEFCDDTKKLGRSPGNQGNNLRLKCADRSLEGFEEGSEEGFEESKLVITYHRHSGIVQHYSSTQPLPTQSLIPWLEMELLKGLNHDTLLKIVTDVVNIILYI